MIKEISILSTIHFFHKSSQYLSPGIFHDLWNSGAEGARAPALFLHYFSFSNVKGKECKKNYT